jgi:enoyl-[acyl-carrier protein] reductase II
MKNRICELLGTRYPVIQAGMVWCSGWKLAAAVSNAGAFGMIGSGSMTPDLLHAHIQKARAATNLPFGVNIPLLYTHAKEMIQCVVEEKVPVVFTSAGNPGLYTLRLKEAGIRVVHVVSSLMFAEKALNAGVDAIVAEGFEAGGHNGMEESTTFTLIPLVRKHCPLPLIAAGGIATGAGMLAAMALGAEGVQIGTRFVASKESSAHDEFKKILLKIKEGDTRLYLRRTAPVRMINNTFARMLGVAENSGADEKTLLAMLGKGRSKKGMFEGDLEEGELEIGQVASMIEEIKPAAAIVEELIMEYESVRKLLGGAQFEL